MSRLVRWPRLDEANTTIPRLAPAYWTLDFNLDMIATVISTAADAIRVKAVFRTNEDLAGLIWDIEDAKDHGSFKYPRRKDWRGCSVAFDWASAGIRRMDKLQSVTLTVETYAGATHFVRLWNYKTAGTADACHIAFVCDATTKSGYSADTLVPWDDVKRLFISLQPTAAGRGDCSLAANMAAGDTVVHLNVGDAGNIRAGDVLFMLGASDAGAPYTVSSNTVGAVQVVTFAPPLQTLNSVAIVAGAEAFVQPAAIHVEQIGESAAQIDISNMTVTGPNSTLPIRTTPMAVNGLGMTDGYDNGYPLNPQRIVDQVYALGYRDRYVLYMGISKFHSLSWNAGEARYVVDTAKPALNAPTEQWLTDFFTRLHAKGFEIVISVSFEILNRYIPTVWKQLDKDGNDARTGWTPPSSLIAPTVGAALDYLVSVFVAVMAKLPAGAAYRFQIGEPTWWGGQFSNNAPYIYDATTQAAYVAAVGAVPLPKLATIFGQPAAQHAPYLAFCRDKLGAATTYVKTQVLAARPAATSYLLLFVPQILADGAPMLFTLNFPQADWDHTHFDKLQVEDYDWVIDAKFDKLPQTWMLAQAMLGYTLANTEYFVGFNLLASTLYVWENIDYALWLTAPRGPSHMYVWSREQVCRDGWVYDRQVQMVYGDLTHLAQCWKVTRSDAVVEGFTSHDRPLTLAGVTYQPANSFKASALVSDSEMAVANVEVVGAIDADEISAVNLLAGVYDGAQVELFLVDWSDLTLPKRIMRRGWMGTVKQSGSGFTAELDGLALKIQAPVIEAVTPECRVDLYSTPCGIARAAFTVAGVVTAVSDGTLGAVNSGELFFASGLAQADGWFDGGDVIWTAGANAGRKAEIRAWLHSNGGQIELWEPTDFAIAVGDTFSIAAGCDKRRQTCFGKFNNIANHRGFPDVPGMDSILQTPNATSG